MATKGGSFAVLRKEEKILKKAAEKAKPPEQIFKVDIGNRRWGDLSDDDDDDDDLAVLQPKRDSDTSSDEEEEEEEEVQETNEVAEVVKETVKPVPKTDAFQNLTKKERKEKEMEELNKILSEFDTGGTTATTNSSPGDAPAQGKKR
eukprot:Platyproteum_vivax@DN7619_c0_g2_i1.p2